MRPSATTMQPVDVNTPQALSDLEVTFQDMQHAGADLDHPEAETHYELLVDARYIGQSYELTVAWD